MIFLRRQLLILLENLVNVNMELDSSFFLEQIVMLTKKTRNKIVVTRLPLRKPVLKLV